MIPDQTDLDRIDRLAAAMRHLHDTDPLSYRLHQQAASADDEATLEHWSREAQAGRYHPTYV